MKRKTEFIATRLNTEDKQLLEKVCDARGEYVSDFVRRAIKKELASLSFYPEEIKKALGILQNPPQVSESHSQEGGKNP